MYEQFIIKGLGGKRSLAGEVRINGAKNAVLKAMAAAILFDGPLTLENVPDTEDVGKMTDLLIALGANVVHDIAEKKITIDVNPSGPAKGITSTDLDHAISQSMRSSVVATGPLLARYGKVSFPAPGGCVIGARPVDRFIDGYIKMGADVKVTAITNGSRYVVSVAKEALRGAEIIFPFQTVGGTETLMMAAVLAHGTTTLKNVAMEPEIIDLAEFLVSCGAEITGLGTPTITIIGTKGKLLSAKSGAGKIKSYITIPDRIEAGSFLLLGAVCARDLKITHCNPAHLEVVIAMLRDSGVHIETGADFIHVKGNVAAAKVGQVPHLTSFNIRTHEYPGFPTDLQAQAVAYLTQTSGEGIVFETIFEGRFKYADDLKKMGAGITVMNPREILVKGPADLTALDGEDLQAYDIRAGFAVVMAALLATGTSVIKNIYFIDRGYEALEVRLRTLGADMQRVSVEN